MPFMSENPVDWGLPAEALPISLTGIDSDVWRYGDYVYKIYTNLSLPQVELYRKVQNRCSLEMANHPEIMKFGRSNYRVRCSMVNPVEDVRLKKIRERSGIPSYYPEAISRYVQGPDLTVVYDRGVILSSDSDLPHNEFENFVRFKNLYCAEHDVYNQLIHFLDRLSKRFMYATQTLGISVIPLNVKIRMTDPNILDLNVTDICRDIKLLKNLDLLNLRTSNLGS